MTTPNPVTWQDLLEKSAPALHKEVSSVRESVLVEGALPLKVKILMTMLWTLCWPTRMASLPSPTGPGLPAPPRKKLLKR